jgi:TetR/AcrR family transcriptional repressor of nem operon
MKEAGLTHGGFYGHFSSKEDLIAEASARALTSSLELWSKLAERASSDSLSAIAGVYLTSTHRDNPGAGCLLAALGSDVSRQGPAVRRAVTDYLRSTVDLLARLVPAKSKAARRHKAITTYATLVGAMVVARAVNDRALSQESWTPAWRLLRPDAANHAVNRLRGRPPFAPLAFAAAAFAFERLRPPRRPVEAANNRVPNVCSTSPGTETSTSSEGHDNASPAGETTIDWIFVSEARSRPGTSLRGMDIDPPPANLKSIASASESYRALTTADASSARAFPRARA